jgi:hypothetical protein
MNVYVWYRVERDEAETETAIRAMMARVGCRAGVAGRLMKKQGEPRLWMEVYEGVADAAAFTRILDEKAEAYDVGMFIDGPRRVECFMDTGVIPTTCGI